MDSYRKPAFDLDSLPGRLPAEEVARVLGFQPHDIPILAAAGLLEPLGTPANNAPKMYMTTEILELRADRAFLDRATRALQKHWLKKRQNKSHTNGRVQPGLRRRAGSTPTQRNSIQKDDAA